MPSYEQYWACVRQERLDAQLAVDAKYRTLEHRRRSEWLEQQMENYDSANAVSEAEAAMLARFGEWVKGRAQ